MTKPIIYRYKTVNRKPLSNRNIVGLMTFPSDLIVFTEFSFSLIWAFDILNLPGLLAMRHFKL